MAIIQNITEYYVLSNGDVIKPSGITKFHAQSNRANVIIVYLQDGVGFNSTTLINFTPKERSTYTSHWFYMTPTNNVVEKQIPTTNEVITFSEFKILVPKIVLQSQNGNQKEIFMTLVQRYGERHLGTYESLTSIGFPQASDEIRTSRGVVYVIDEQSFYQVELDNGINVWVPVNKIKSLLTTKQYDLFNAFVQAGFSNDKPTTLDKEVINHFMQELNDTQTRLNELENALEELEKTIYISESQFSTITREQDKVYGVYNETDGIITFYYGDIGG